MKSAPTWLLVLAASACGGSDGARRGKDAAVPDGGGGRDASVGRDGAKDVPAGTADGGGTARDGAAGLDGPALVRPDVPWMVPDGANACHVDITAVTPPSLTELTAGPTAFLRVQGSVIWSDTRPFQPSWTWLVTRPDGQAVTSKTVAGDPSQIQFPISLAGRYDIAADIGGGCGGTARALVQEAQNQSRSYRVRALPPASSSAAVPYEVDVKLVAGVFSVTSDIAFDTGIPVAIDPTRIARPGLATAVPSYIRIQSSASTWVFSGRSSNQGPLRTVLDLMLEYEVLVVPDLPAQGAQGLPPFLLNRSTSGDSKVDARYIGAYANQLSLPDGITISGHLLGPDGPVEGATVSLDAYQSSGATGLAVMSTVGRSGNDGAYSLRVNPAGAFSIVIAPPAGSPLPLATAAQGITLADSTTVVPNVDFRWLALPTTDLSIAVTLPNGSVPPDTVAVHLESTSPNTISAGVLTVGTGGDGDGDGGASGWTSQATGTVRRDGTTDGHGVATFPALPKGNYDVTLVPPESLSGWGTTRAKVDTGLAGDSIGIAVPLAAKVVVMGRLLDAQTNTATDAAGATVVATDVGSGTRIQPATSVVAADGTFFLFVDPDRTYRLAAQPLAGRGLPSWVPLYGFSIGRSNMVLDDQRVPKGVLVAGRVTYAGTPVVGAVLQAFCIGLPPDCVDRTNLAAGSPPAFASATSDGSGSYAFFLPDPATAR